MSRRLSGSLFAICALSAALAAAGCTARSMPPSGTDASVDAPFFPEIDAQPVDTGVDAYVECEPGEILCPSGCTRVAADSLNCGSCGNACPAGSSCAVGRCDCLEPMLACDGVCLDPRTDTRHCGACDNACSAIQTCTDGACVLDCDAPNMVCRNRDATTGELVEVCADVSTDPMNCGTCNTVCGAGSTCVAGYCRCPTGWLNCGGRCVDVSTDPANCGSCGISCGTGGVCAASACTSCGSDRMMCSGRCIDTMTDRLNCGSCGRACGAGEACAGGLCECATGLTDCGTGCLNLMTNPMNCGTCGTSCGAGGICTAGACSCAPGYTMCGAACADTTRDIANCGACGTTCAAGEYCIMSACTTAPPTRYMMTTPTALEAPYVDACAAPGRTVILPSADDQSARVMLPFPFRFWATDLPAGAMINITTNGWIGMNGTASADRFPTAPPTAAAPNAMIAVHWRDLVTRASGICIATVGTAPTRQWVVEWRDVENFSPGGESLTFEAVLTEGAGTIDLIYQSMTGALAGGMAVENQTGTMAVNACPGGTATCVPTTGQRVRFVPIP